MTLVAGPDILIRADASLRIGTGHIFRTLVLASWLHKRGHRVGFAMRSLPGNLIDRVREHGFAVFVLDDGDAEQVDSWLAVSPADELRAMSRLLETFEASPRWLVADSYAIGAEWEHAMRSRGIKVCAIADLANREYVADAVIDSSLGPLDRYQTLVPPATRMLLGPRYALVRDGFVAERLHHRVRDGVVRRIQIFYGGVDWSNETVKALHALRDVAGEFSIDVVIGSTNPQRDCVARAVDGDRRARLWAGDDAMARLTAHADLALGAAGSAMLERVFVGTPSLLTSLLPDLEAYGRQYAETGAAVYLGGPEVLPERIVAEVSAMLANPDRVRSASAIAWGLADGFEAARAEIEALFV